jgi:ornithine cyclodeaminase/alanine dehydrogenase
MEETITLVEKAFAELVQGTAWMPQRTAVTDPPHNGWIAFMPAHLKGMGALGVKAVTVYKDNPAKHKLPTTLATITLLDAETGRAVAIMDGGYLTAMRTGAVTGVATKYLARKNARVAGVLGTGVQARTQVMGMAAACKLEKVVCASVDSPEVQQAFVKDMSQRAGVPVQLVGSVREVVEQSDVLALATTASKPIVDGDWFKPGVHINSIGSHAPGVRELDTKTVVRSKIVCDHTAACLAEAGDIQIPIQEGVLKPESIYGELGEVITGKKRGRENDREITLFKSVGLSIQDISAAYLVYRKALERKVGVEFQF